jgi:hypothetical protein
VWCCARGRGVVALIYRAAKGSCVRATQFGLPSCVCVQDELRPGIYPTRIQFSNFPKTEKPKT